MSETKRPLDEDLLDLASHDDKKQHTKPGRKPIDTEPKSKRTAQNRAAQRAYRERKERKMKDLEDKVSFLEDDKMRAEEQIERLKAELSRFRGHSDFSDLITSNITKPRRESTNSGISSSGFTVGTPWGKKNSIGSDTRSNASASHLPDLTSGSSSSTSPLNENVISPHSNASDNYSVPSTGMLDARHAKSSLFEEELDPFCASLNEACGTRFKPVPKFHRDSQSFPPNQKTNAPTISSASTQSPFQSLFTPNLDIPDPLFNSTGESAFNFSLDNPLNKEPSLFNDVNFDVNLALENLSHDPVQNNSPGYADTDALAGLVSEESAYDPFAPANTDFNFNEFVKSSYSGSESSRNNSVVEGHKHVSSVTSFNSPAIKEEEKDEVVPGPQETLKCSEIWDRITAHPRYTEIDIDGLCSELKSKAKCSEKGVVLNANDVNALIERSAERC